MSELKNFYKKWLTTVALMIALGTYFMATFAVPALEQLYSRDHWSVTLSNFVTSRPALLVLIAVSEWLIRKKVWRWLHPELDFAGTWNGTSTYTHVHVGNGPVPREVTHEARIEQDCLSIRLIPAEGPNYTRFESTAVNLHDAHRLVYSYYVKYKDGVPNFPTETYGYEEMNPVGETDARGRPVKLNGWFAHCARPGQEPVYSGAVVFTRK